MAHQVFISYAFQDKTAADTVCHVLEVNAIRCWIAPRDIRPGRDYSEEILRGIEESTALLLVFSGHANQSQHVKREIERAVDKKKLIIPFRIEEIQPSGPLEYFISSTHWLNAFPPPLENHLHNLPENVKEILAQPDTPKKPPAPPGPSPLKDNSPGFKTAPPKTRLTVTVEPPGAVINVWKIKVSSPRAWSSCRATTM